MSIEEMQTQRDADYEKYKAEGRIWGTVPREKIARIQIPRTSKEVIDRFYALEDMSTAVSGAYYYAPSEELLEEVLEG